MKRFIIFTLLMFFFFSTNAQHCEIRMKMDTCLYDTVLKAEYNILHQSVEELEFTNGKLNNDLKIMRDRMRSLALDEFLNIQDTSIFGSKFQSVDPASLCARSRDFYNLIRLIHDLKCTLDPKVEGSTAEFLKKLKESSEKALHIIDSINSDVSDNVFSWLSQPQKAYYRALIEQYNDIINNVN